MAEPYDTAAKILAADMDGALTTAVNRQLGVGAWLMADLAGRLERVTFAQEPGWEHFYLDGKPLLKAGPMKVEQVNGGLTASRQILMAKAPAAG